MAVATFEAHAPSMGPITAQPIVCGRSRVTRARFPWRVVEQDRWLALFLLARGLAAAAAIGLLVAHRVTGHDPSLIGGAIVMGPAAMIVAAASERLRRSPVTWAVDAALVLALVVASEDWRSPFYLMALTTLIFPAVTLDVRAAGAWGTAFAAAYLGVAVATGLEAQTLDSTIRLETLATHVLVPALLVLALAYASDVLVRLRLEEERAMGLAVDKERRRIAWELHDSAKQRVHAAHLLLTAGRARLGDGADSLIDQALTELQAATGDMDTSVRELQTPLDGRRLDEALRARAAELSALTDADIEVLGDAPLLSATVTAHAYRILAEALLNAVRHADAGSIALAFEQRDGMLRARVTDDGRGLPCDGRPGSHGLSFMGHRAATIGGRLQFGRGTGGRGTSIVLDIPLDKEPTL